MSVSCLRARSLFAGYAAEALAPADRRALRTHLADCRACRDDAAREDEGLLFAGVGGEEVSAEEVAQVLSGVRAGIALRQAERRLEKGFVRDRRPRSLEGGALGHRRAVVAAAAAALVVCTLLLSGAPARRAKPSAVQSVESRSLSESPLVPAARPATVPVQPVPDSKFPADATIYDWNPGSGQPRVVWIVDRSLDI